MSEPRALVPNPPEAGTPITAPITAPTPPEVTVLSKPEQPEVAAPSETEVLVDASPLRSPLTREETEPGPNGQPLFDPEEAERPLATDERFVDPLGGLSEEEVFAREVRVVTPVHQAAYYTYVADGVLFLLAAVFFIAKANRNRRKVRYAPMLGYGFFLGSLGVFLLAVGYYFNMYLQGSAPTFSIAARGFAWAILAPVLFGLFSRLVKVHAGDRVQYSVMFLTGSGIFLCIGLSQLPVLGSSLQIGLAIAAFFCSGSLTWLLYSTLGALSEAMTGKLRHGFKTVIFTIMTGWFFYPLINLVTLLLLGGEDQQPDQALARLLLNVLDLALMSLLTFGIYESVSNKQGHIHIKPAFGNAKAVDETIQKDIAGEVDKPLSAPPPPSGTTPPKAPPPAPAGGPPPKAPPPQPGGSTPPTRQPDGPSDRPRAKPKAPPPPGD